MDTTGEHYKEEPLVMEQARERASNRMKDNRMKDNTGQTKRKKANTGQPRRTGRKRNATGEEVTEPKFKANSDGCEHDNPDNWQRSQDVLYFKPGWRRKHPDRCISLKCYNCKENV